MSTLRKWLVRIMAAPLLLGAALTVGAPMAWADDADDCHPSKGPDSAGSGLPGIIDDQAESSTGGSSTLYEKYGWSGLKWSTCNLADPTTGGSITGWNDRPDAVKDMSAFVDTSVGNFFMSGAAVLGATMTQLDQWTSDPSALMSPVDGAVGDASNAIMGALWGTKGALAIGPLVVMLAGVIVLWWARSGDTRHSLRTVVAVLVGALCLGALTVQWPVTPTEANGYQTQAPGAVGLGQSFDHVASGVIGSVSSAAINSPGTPANTAYGTTLYDKILVPIWIQGAVGTGAGDVQDANSLAGRIFSANTSQWGQTQDDSAYQAVAKCLLGEGKDCGSIQVSPDTYHQLQGKEGGRAGLGFMAFLTMLLIGIIRIPCALLLLMGLIVIRFVVVFLSVWACLAMIEATRPTAIGAGRMVLASVYNATVFGIFGLMDVLIGGAIIASGNHGFTFVKLVLIAVLTAVIWVISKPFRSVTVPATGNILGNAEDQVRGTGSRVRGMITGLSGIYLGNKLANRRSSSPPPDLQDEMLPDAGPGAPMSSGFDGSTTEYTIPDSSTTTRQRVVRPSFQPPVTEVQAPVKLRPVVEWEDLGGGQVKPHFQTPFGLQKPFGLQAPLVFRDTSYESAPPVPAPSLTWVPPTERSRQPIYQDRDRFQPPQEVSWTPPTVTTTTGESYNMLAR